MLRGIVNIVREKKPLIHAITNYVTVNDVANVLLACGGSPIMADDKEEVEEITTLCDGLCINIGTLNNHTIPSMFLAAKKANIYHHPIVLDPVGAGASTMRTKISKQLIQEVTIDVVRGNISEIKAIVSNVFDTQGVDANSSDAITEENLDTMIPIVKQWAKEINSIIVITGAIDLVSDATTCYVLHHGRKEMASITGTGCQLSGIVSAYIASVPDQKLEAAMCAVCLMGIAGEVAWQYKKPYEGNATYRNRIIDAIYTINGQELEGIAKYEKR